MHLTALLDAPDFRLQSPPNSIYTFCHAKISRTKDASQCWSNAEHLGRLQFILHHLSPSLPYVGFFHLRLEALPGSTGDTRIDFCP